MPGGLARQDAKAPAPRSIHRYRSTATDPLLRSTAAAPLHLVVGVEGGRRRRQARVDVSVADARDAIGRDDLLVLHCRRHVATVGRGEVDGDGPWLEPRNHRRIDQFWRGLALRELQRRVARLREQQKPASCHVMASSRHVRICRMLGPGGEEAWSRLGAFTGGPYAKATARRHSQGAVRAPARNRDAPG